MIKFWCAFQLTLNEKRVFMTTIKRTITLTLILSIFILTGCTSNTSEQQIKSGKDLSFFITSDIHYLAKDLTDDGEAFQKFVNGGDGKQLNYIGEIMDAFTSEIKRKKPDVLIISGDLTTNGEKESHQELAKKLKTIKELGTSVYVIPGNHDILNPYARSFKGSDQYQADYIDVKDFSKIYGDFGYNQALSRDAYSLSYLAAPSKDVWLLMLDTAQYKNNISAGQPQVDGEINPETLEWIKKCSNMAKESNAQLIAVMHHNLIDHSETIKDGYTLNNNKAALEAFQSCGINLTFTGHIHLQDIKSVKSGDDVIYDIAAGALGVYPQKYGVLKYSPNTGYDYNTVKVDVEGWAKQTGSTDNNLRNFGTFSETFFKNISYNSAYRRLVMDDDLTSEEIKLMAETSAVIRTKYYEGTENSYREEIKNSQGYKLWTSYKVDGSQRNLLKMLNTDDSINNKLHFKK